MSVSTCFCSSRMPASASAHAALAFELERLGDDADGQDAGFARRPRHDRRRARAGAAAHAGGDEGHVRAREMIVDLVERLLRGGAADLRLRAGAEPLRDRHAHLDEAVGLRHGERLGVGVGDDEVDALQPRLDHVVDRVAAGAADPEDGDPRLEFRDVGHLQIDTHRSVLFAFPPGRASPPALFLAASSEALPDPASHARQVSVRSRHREARRSAGVELFDLRHLRVDDETDRGRESRALGRFRQAGDAERPAEPDVARRACAAPSRRGR